MKADKQPGFEKALERLETLVIEMEKGTLSLDKMMAHFEEGMKLVKLCSVRLDEVERRIEILVKQGDAVDAQPFQIADQFGDQTHAATEPAAADEQEDDTE